MIKLGPGVKEPFETGAKVCTELAVSAANAAAGRGRAME